MKEYKTQDLRNVSIVGGAQFGKTTLGEAIIFNSGSVSRQGSVDDGSSLLDFTPEEAGKKISMSSSLLYAENNGHKINFIDTPGYTAFVSFVEAAVNVCESSLIVLDAEAGVDVGAKKAWKRANENNQSRFLFINKMDKERIDFDTIINEAKTQLSNGVCAVCLPIGEAEGFKGLVDIIKQKAYIDNGQKMDEQDIPAEMVDQVTELRNALMEAAAENSEELLEKYLEAGELEETDLIEGIRAGILSNDICLAVPGCARNNIGINKLVEILSTFAPSPDQKPGVTYITDDEKELVEKIDMAAGHTAHAFKIIDDPKVGEYFFIKVVGGAVKSSLEMQNLNSSQKERIGHLFAFMGKNREEIDVLYAGDIGATAKLKTTLVGHTLCESKNGNQIKPINFPTTVTAEAVKPENEKDNEKLVEAIHAINRVDPCFYTEHKAEFNERVLFGMSKLHIDSMVDKIKSKLNINLTLFKPCVPYRETFRKGAKAQGKYKKQTGGHGQYGDAHIEIIPKPSGSGYSFTDNITGGVIPGKFIPAVDKGIKESMKSGIVAGYPVVDFEISLFFGSYHNVDSSDLAFQMAGSLAFKKAAESADPVLLEPIQELKVTIPDDSVGDVSADFNQRRGRILGMDPLGNGYTCITAHVPKGELYNYSVDLDSITKGDAEFTENFDKYEPVPSSMAEKVIKEAKAALEKE